ncbi:phosphoglycerate mutase 2, partial [mine drainage metagenome]
MASRRILVNEDNKMEEGLILTLIRHGETDGNLNRRWQGDTDAGLNDRGRKQVLEVAEKLKNQDFDIIMHSGMRRSFESAAILMDRLKVKEIGMFTALRDRSMGAAENLTSEEVEQKYGFYFTNILSEDVDALPGAETIAHLVSRVDNTRKYLAERYQGKKILAVSHGGFLRMFYREFVDDPHHIRFVNCSYYTVSIRTERTDLIEA